ncbi:hypothetical protein Taro_042540 [Colocasia esculenta]|uniref:Uncharacterized protein n=1 Tax=Colocasia esculenta TaxID=4460 RepID=A0A843WE82_COLES|nr:hypothetical protein [Colocasia esculenta]
MRQVGSLRSVTEGLCCRVGCHCVALEVEVYRWVALCSGDVFPEPLAVVLVRVALRTVSGLFLLAVSCVPALADDPSGGFRRGYRACLCLLGLS